ncbi:MAG: hypothetical protein ACLUJG_15750 [Lawsonibacter sp.]
MRATAGQGRTLEGYLDGCIAFARAAAGAGKRVRPASVEPGCRAETEGANRQNGQILSRLPGGISRALAAPDRRGTFHPGPRAFTSGVWREISSGPTCPLQRRRAGPLLLRACGTRWAYCGDGTVAAAASLVHC